jgi:lipoprotein-releasing system ATP-binding protein
VTVPLAVRGLTFAYRRGAPPVFADLSRDFAAGAVTAITGPSGSGKSTLLYVLGLMLTPTAGTVSWRGEPVTAWRDGDRSRLRAAHIGFVFQDALLDPSRSALGNVAEAGAIAGMPAPDVTREALALMRRFGVAERAHHRPGEVSGGQAQRIALCRALVKRPAVILADEPSGNLDPDSADVVWNALYDAAAGGATVVAATHDRARAAAAAGQLVIGA